LNAHIPLYKIKVKQAKMSFAFPDFTPKHPAISGCGDGATVLPMSMPMPVSSDGATNERGEQLVVMASVKAGR
jgi:hypothetical protein